MEFDASTSRLRESEIGVADHLRADELMRRRIVGTVPQCIPSLRYLAISRRHPVDDSRVVTRRWVCYYIASPRKAIAIPMEEGERVEEYCRNAVDAEAFDRFDGKCCCCVLGCVFLTTRDCRTIRAAPLSSRFVGSLTFAFPLLIPLESMSTHTKVHSERVCAATTAGTRERRDRHRTSTMQNASA